MFCVEHLVFRGEQKKRFFFLFVRLCIQSVTNATDKGNLELWHSCTYWEVNVFFCFVCILGQCVAMQQTKVIWNCNILALIVRWTSMTVHTVHDRSATFLVLHLHLLFTNKTTKGQKVKDTINWFSVSPVESGKRWKLNFDIFLQT